MDEIDQFAIEVQRQIVENRKKIDRMADFEARQNRPLGSNALVNL